MKRLIWIVVSAVGAALLVGWLGQHGLQIDACLDNGGAWNYELNKCEGEKAAEPTP